jgi:hypothetical protein
MNKNGVTMEEKCTCGHTKEEHSHTNGIGNWCRFASDCGCMEFDTEHDHRLFSDGTFVGVMVEDESEDEDDE